MSKAASLKKSMDSGGACYMDLSPFSPLSFRYLRMKLPFTLLITMVDGMTSDLYSASCAFMEVARKRQARKNIKKHAVGESC